MHKFSSYLVFYLNALSSDLKCFSSLVNFVEVKRNQKTRQEKKIEKFGRKKKEKNGERRSCRDGIDLGLESHGRHLGCSYGPWFSDP